MEYNLIDIFLWSFSAVYVLAALALTLGLALYRPKKTDSRPFVSVVIAARNEAPRIGSCLEKLLEQSYDAELMEVIVVDDRSTDGTSDRVRAFEKKFRSLKCLTIGTVPPDMAPKKNAIAEGIRIARGEIILCTDADCRPDRNWIAAMAECFTDEVGAVVGYSPIEPGNAFSVFENFLALDALALASVGAGSSAWNGTLTATGRSFGYRKKVFQEVGGFSKIARFISGDDDLLLGLIQRTKWKVAYATGKHSCVGTDPPENFGAFVNQKIRQASKGMHYAPERVLILFLLLVFNFLLISYLPWKWIAEGVTAGNAAPWIVKLLADLCIVLTGAWRFDKWSTLKMYPIAAILHPVFIVVFGIWGRFGKFEWK